MYIKKGIMGACLLILFPCFAMEEEDENKVVKKETINSPRGEFEEMLYSLLSPRLRVLLCNTSDCENRLRTEITRLYHENRTKIDPLINAYMQLASEKAQGKEEMKHNYKLLNLKTKLDAYLIEAFTYALVEKHKNEEKRSK